MPSENWSERAYQKLLGTFDHIPADRRRMWVYYKLWPNTAFDIYPDQVDFMQFIPVSATQTMIREIAYVHPNQSRELNAARYLNWRINRQVNAEDTTLIEGVQQAWKVVELHQRAAVAEGSVPDFLPQAHAKRSFLKPISSTRRPRALPRGFARAGRQSPRACAGSVREHDREFGSGQSRNRSPAHSLICRLAGAHQPNTATFGDA